MRRNPPQQHGTYVPSEQALFYAANGYVVIDDLTPNQVLVIHRDQTSQPMKVPRDGP